MKKNSEWNFQTCSFQYGFIDYDMGEGKKLFFHMSEVVDGIELKSGDEVEFVLVQNQRNGRHSAVNVRRLR